MSMARDQARQWEDAERRRCEAQRGMLDMARELRALREENAALRSERDGLLRQLHAATHRAVVPLDECRMCARARQAAA